MSKRSTGGKGEQMEFGRANKRPRLEIRLNSDGNEYESESSSFCTASEYASEHISNGEGAVTSDSGFNDFTPPRSTDDESSNFNQTPKHIEKDYSIPCDGTNVGEGDNSLDSTDSDVSGLSTDSDPNENWAATAEAHMLFRLCGGDINTPENMNAEMLWNFLSLTQQSPPRREKLRHINTFEDVLRLIKTSKKVIILTGAGISVSCGIPDFRSKDGIYDRLKVDFPDLPSPQAMFDLNYFRNDPRIFFQFARDIYPGQFKPSLSHRFIKAVEDNNKLLRNYTQNIDTLERIVGVKNLLECHGSFATASCLRCRHKVDSDEIKSEILRQDIPKCKKCLSDDTFSQTPPQILFPAALSDSSEAFSLCPDQSIFNKPIMKPDIVFFGEGLSEEYHEKMDQDVREGDLLIVIGSSLKVRPVCTIPNLLPGNVPQILINREPLPHLNFDVELLGDCDVILSEISRRLGNSFSELPVGEPLKEIDRFPPKEDMSERTPSIVPKDETDLEALRTCWEPKIRESLASRLPGEEPERLADKFKDDSYYYNGANRYIFKGAEVYVDPDDEIDSSDSSDSSDDELDDPSSPTDLLNTVQNTVESSTN